MLWEAMIEFLLGLLYAIISFSILFTVLTLMRYHYVDVKSESEDKESKDKEETVTERVKGTCPFPTLASLSTDNDVFHFIQ